MTEEVVRQSVPEHNAAIHLVFGEKTRRSMEHE